ncbi:hypothetical protein GGR42_000468 [Saonia flava]|uniref:Uncharacterized protein n=1 Tax=Saonia flava TaxID=523696 RepID=A0A846QM09_9FLAO|nr:hypothetical protein [Saonia flava]NJB70006.1 hypothetical protein [Saonia flava]
MSNYVAHIASYNKEIMRVIASVLIFLLFMGCSKSNDNDGRKDYFFYTESQIVLEDSGGNNFAKIVDGENLVFEYFFQHPDQENIADDEYSERIIFEMDASLSSFSISNTTLTEYNTYFDEYCFCGLQGSTPITFGTIKGTKIDENRWDITLNVSFEMYDETRTKEVNHRFVLTEK